jgi:hypothetical protein
MQGIKHLIECHCVLPQFRQAGKPYHQFVVFSILDDSDTVLEKQARCNNCGVVHNVIDIGKSQILGGQEVGAIMDKDDVSLMLPSSLTNILKNYDCDISTWEQVLFLVQNDEWGSEVILTREEDETGDINGKKLLLKSPAQYQLVPYIYRRSVQ